MATPNEIKNKSATSPQLSSTLRKIIFLDRVTTTRNKEYENKLSDFIKKQKELQSGLSQDELNGMVKGFTRQYYRIEYDALSKYQAMKIELDALNEKQSSKKLTKKETSKQEELSFFVDMGPEAYAASQFFNDKNISELKKEYPLVEKQIKAEIKGIAEADYPNLSASMGARPAGVDLFNKSYPNLASQLKGELKGVTPDARRAALGLLKAGAVLSNPSSFLLSKGIGAILRTPTFKNMTSEIGESIKRTAESTGITGKLKKAMGSWSDVSMKRVATGVAAVGVVGMVTLGVMETESAEQLYADIRDSILDFSQTTGPEPDNNPTAYGNAEAKNSNMEFDKILGEEEPPLKVEETHTNPSVQAAAEAQRVLMEGEASTFDVFASLSNIKGETLSVAEIAEALDTGAKVDEVNNVATQEAKSMPVISGGEYKIKAGDTLSELVEERLKQTGNPYNYALIDSYVQQIAESSGRENADLIFPGDKITFPDMSSSTPIVSDKTLSMAVDEMTEYKPTECTDRVLNSLSSHNDPAHDAIERAAGLLNSDSSCQINPSLDNTAETTANDRSRNGSYRRI